MEQSSSTFKYWRSRVRNILFSERFYVFLVCVGIATVFWFLNTFTKNHTTTFYFPVVYKSLPENQVVTNELPEKIGIEVDGYGFDLLSYSFRSDQDTIVLSGSDLENTTAKGALYSIPSRSLVDNIESSLGRSNIRITRMLSDTIHLRMEEKLIRLATVFVESDLSFDTYYHQSGDVKIDPAVVQVSGPETQVKSLSEISTTVISEENVRGDIHRRVALELPSGARNVKIEPAMVDVVIPVDKFTETSIDLSLSVDNLPDSLDLLTYPQTVNLSYRVPLKQFDRVTSDLFELSVDFEETSQSSTRKLKVNVKKVPDFVTVNSIYPTKVEYIPKLRK